MEENLNNEDSSHLEMKITHYWLNPRACFTSQDILKLLDQIINET